MTDMADRGQAASVTREHGEEVALEPIDTGLDADDGGDARAASDDAAILTRPEPTGRRTNLATGNEDEAFGHGIIVTMTPDETSRTPNKGCFWTAECVVDGLTFTAQSRNGASCALARVLVVAGIADRPMIVRGPAGSFTWASFHAA